MNQWHIKVRMVFVRSYFGTNEPLTSWTHFSSLFGWISTDLAKKWGKMCSTGQRFICTEVTSYKIHDILGVQNGLYFVSQIFKKKSNFFPFFLTQNFTSVSYMIFSYKQILHVSMYLWARNPIFFFKPENLNQGHCQWLICN